MNPGERAWVLRALHLLYASGVGLDRALDALEPQAEQLETRLALVSVSKSLREGHSFSWSLKHSNLFDGIQASLVYLGEKVGALDTVLDRLAEQEEARARLSARLRASLIYPAFLALVGLVMVCTVPAVLLGSLLDFLVQVQADLPLLTQAVLVLSNLLRNPAFWLVWVGVAGFLWRPLAEAWRREESRLGWEARLRRVPGPGKMWSWLVAARFGGALKTVVSSGAPILEGIVLAAECSGSPTLNLQARRLARSVVNGVNLSRAMQQMEMLPAAFRHCLVVGLETGRMETLTAAAARLAEDEFNSALEAVCSLLEPIVIGVMGLVVGLLLLGTMLPLVKLMEKL